MWLRNKFRKPTFWDSVRDILHVVFTAISFVDIVIALLLHRGLLVSRFIRIIRVSMSYRQIRITLKRIVQVLYDSLHIFILMLAYVLVFSYIGYRLFRGYGEGEEYFGSISDSAWNLLVLLTASNLPQIAFPAYKMGVAYVLFYIFYLIFGLYFLMSLLLALFYSNYRSRQEQSLLRFNDVRSKYLKDKFLFYDASHKGYLTMDECRDMITELLSKYREFSTTNIDVDKFVALLDKNGDNKVTPQEFSHYFDVLDRLHIERTEAVIEPRDEPLFRKRLRMIFKHPFYEA